MESFAFYDLGRIDYHEALLRQTAAFESLLQKKKEQATGQNELLFCEHNPVLTIGKSGNQHNLLVSEELLKLKGVALYHINRGGDITYHGPGQITGYPIFDLDYYGLGLKQYIHLMEECIIRFLRHYHIEAARLEGATGVWLDADKPGSQRKICAIGVKSSRFVTMHGFAVNINTDLSYYRLINPCGFVDKGVTSLENELGSPVDMQAAKQLLRAIFSSLFPAQTV